MANEDARADSMSDESKDYMEEVKKGKPRKFAMICKGSNIVSLVVYKKGNVEKRKKEAKESGRGQFYFGVVEGKGMDISFLLARADGFESPPVKSTILKSYLNEVADIKCRPLFVIVDTLSLVLDDSDPEIQRFLRLQPKALEACDAFPDRSAEINSLCLQIGNFFDQDEGKSAVEKLDILEKLLASLLPGSSGSATASPPPAAPSPEGEIPAPPAESPSDVERKNLREKLSKMVPLVQQAVVKKPEQKGEVLGLVANIKKNLDNLELVDFTETKRWMVSLGAMLKEIAAGGSAEPGSSDWREKLLSELTGLTPSLKQVIAADPSRKGELLSFTAKIKGRLEDKADNDSQGIQSSLQQLKTLLQGSESQEDGSVGLEDWKSVASEFASQRKRIAQYLASRLEEADRLIAEAKGLAEQGNYAQAVDVAMKLAAIDELARRALLETEVDEMIPEHVVEERKAFLLSRWQEAIQSTNAEISKLQTVIEELVPEEDANELVASINDDIDEFISDLNLAILGTKSATQGNTRPLKIAQMAIDDYRKRIQSNPMILHLKEAFEELGINVEVESVLTKALDDLKNRLVA